MSWDIHLMAAASPPPPVASMPRDWRGAPMGTPSQVAARIGAALPGCTWSEPGWGTIGGDGFQIEINIGAKDPVTSVALHVYGGGPAAIEAITALASRPGWYAIDTGQGEWLHHAQGLDVGWQRFKAYRNRVLARLPQGPDGDT